MLLRQKPHTPQLYHITDNKESQELQRHNFHPLYLYNGKFYYEKTKELIEYLRGGENIE